MRQYSALALLIAYLATTPLRCQGQQPNVVPDNQSPPKHILWIIPNFRTSPDLAEYRPLTAKEKFVIAKQDTFDRGTVALAALFAGQKLLANSNPSFGEGVEGFAHYWATSYADYAIGNFMTEGIFPTVLHQDPRYFRRGTGGAWSRLGYSATRIFVTRSDSGHTQFNYSEVIGNSTAVAVSMGYYPENRNAHDAAVSLGTQLAVDMAANIVKEFWPNKIGKPSHSRESGTN